MATNSSALRISELDYNTIRANLKEFLRNQSEFDSYDFEGSGMAVLLDLLAYNTHYMAMNLNLIGNEMFLDTAQLRSSILSHAKMLGYVPTSKRGSVAKINITVTPGTNEDNTAPTLTLSRYTRFLSEPIDGVSYNFVALNANTAFQTGDLTYEFSNVEIKQGEHVTTNFLVDQNNPDRKFNIPSANVDTSTIRITVQESSSNTASRTYTESTDITELTANSYVYFVEENPDLKGTYSIYFGDGTIGYQPANGNIVIVNYIDTLGDLSEKATGFSAINGIGDYDANVIITTVTTASGGSERESIEQARFKAPLYYTAQNRIVTKNDYKSILLKDYPSVQSISVWSGDENIPPVYGKVFISLQPSENYVISESEKLRIVDDIIANRSVLTVFPEIVDPDYTYLLNRVTVYYNPSLTTLDESELKSLVRAAILDYKEDDITGYNAVFRASKLQKYIDLADPSITSCSLNVFTQKRFEPVLGVNGNYTIDFGIPLNKGDSLNKLYSYPEISIRDNLGIARNCQIEEVPDSFTGIDTIEIETSGSEYVIAPTVTISGDGTGATATAKIINGKVTSITITNRGINYTRATIALTGGGGSGASASVKLQARNGTLRTFYYNSLGEKIIINSEAGTIDYDAGLITLTDFYPLELVENALYDNTVCTINIQPLEDTITSERNQILDIDQYDTSSIQIVMVAEDG